MKRWLLLGLVLMVIASATTVTAVRLLRPTRATIALAPPNVHLLLIPQSAYKYHLCTEAYAYIQATADNPYKTDFTFHDPFRNVDDTIIPRLLSINAVDHSLTFSIKVILDKLATFNETIIHVQEQDGIAVQLPDRSNHLQGPGVPQIIINGISLNGNNSVAILDYTCPEQWTWKKA